MVDYDYDVSKFLNKTPPKFTSVDVSKHSEAFGEETMIFLSCIAQYTYKLEETEGT